MSAEARSRNFSSSRKVRGERGEGDSLDQEGSCSHSHSHSRSRSLPSPFHPEFRIGRVLVSCACARARALRLTLSSPLLSPAAGRLLVKLKTTVTAYVLVGETAVQQITEVSSHRPRAHHTALCSLDVTCNCLLLWLRRWTSTRC